MKLLIFSILSLLLSSCSLAPFSTNTSGRSYGAGKFQAEVGNVNSTYNIKVGIGVSPNFDAGYVMEFGAIATSALFFKYSFLNNETGPSLAAEFGYGASDSSSFYYAGAIASLAFNKSFELFINPRVNFVNADKNDVEKDEFLGNVKLTELDTNYLQLTYGMNVWFNQSTGLSLYSVYFKGEDIETSSSSTFGAAFLFNF